MDAAPKIDIKSEIYRAVVPRVARLSQIAWARFRVLPKGNVVKNFLVLYLMVGFILEGVVSSVPTGVVAFVFGPSLHVVSNLLAVAVWLFWPLITWIVLGEVDHTILALTLIFICATYVSHLRQRIVDERFLHPRALPAPAGVHPPLVVDGIAEAEPAELGG